MSLTLYIKNGCEQPHFRKAFIYVVRAAEEEFDELCFEFGIELDDVVSVLEHTEL